MPAVATTELLLSIIADSSSVGALASRKIVISRRLGAGVPVAVEDHFHFSLQKIEPLLQIKPMCCIQSKSTLIWWFLDLTG